jgi:hypothetical protein
MYNGAVFGGDIGSINVGLFAAVGLLGPLLAQIDLMLYGSIGIGALHADFSLQLSAALQASLDIGLNLSNPFIGFSLALSAIATLQAQIALALSGQISFSLDASLQLSANASFSAALSARLGGLELVIQAAIALKIPAIEFLARLNLSAGPLLVASWEDMRLDQAAAQFQFDAANGMSYGPTTINAFDMTYGVVIFTKSPVAWASLRAVLVT